MLSLQHEEIIKNLALFSLSIGGGAEHLHDCLKEQDVISAKTLYEEITGEDAQDISGSELYTLLFKLFIEPQNDGVDATVEEGVIQEFAAISLIDYNTSPDLTVQSASPSSPTSTINSENETMSAPSDKSHFEPKDEQGTEQDVEQDIIHIETQIYTIEEKIQQIYGAYLIQQEVNLIHYMQLFVERNDLIKSFEAKNIELMNLKANKIDSYFANLRAIVGKEKYYIDFSKSITRCYWLVIDGYEIPQTYAMLYSWAVNGQIDDIKIFIASAEDAIQTLSGCKQDYTGIDKDIYDPMNYLQYARCEFARLLLACAAIIQSNNLEVELLKNNLAIIADIFAYLKANVQYGRFEQSGVFLLIEQALDTVLNSVGFKFIAQYKELFFPLLSMQGQIIACSSSQQFNLDVLLPTNQDQDLFAHIKACYAYVCNIEAKASLDPEQQTYLSLLRALVNSYYLTILTGENGKDYAKVPDVEECKLRIKCLSFLAMHLEGKALEQALRCKFEYEKQYIDTLTYKQLMLYREEICLNTVETGLYHAYDQYKLVNYPDMVIDDEVITTKTRREIDVTANAKNRVMIRKYNAKLLEYASKQLDLFSKNWIYTTETKIREMMDEARNSDPHPSIPMRFNI